MLSGQTVTAFKGGKPVEDPEIRLSTGLSTTIVALEPLVEELLDGKAREVCKLVEYVDDLIIIVRSQCLVTRSGNLVCPN